MLEMLKERKAALEAQGKKGFTLMEMLIVIAIIAILIAIAIPLFTQQLNAAKQAADESNARALYAQLQADYMLSQTGTVDNDPGSGVTTTYTAKDGTKTKYVWSDACTAGTITVGTTGTGATAPSVEITTNNKTFKFPENPTGASSAGTTTP